MWSWQHAAAHLLVLPVSLRVSSTLVLLPVLLPRALDLSRFDGLASTSASAHALSAGIFTGAPMPDLASLLAVLFMRWLNALGLAGVRVVRQTSHRVADTSAFRNVHAEHVHSPPMARLKIVLSEDCAMTVSE